ncbi:MAG: FG-GAP-like repeat-containing protein [Vicinamibacterales bacterium]
MFGIHGWRVTRFSSRAGQVRIAMIVLALATPAGARANGTTCPDFAGAIKYGVGGYPQSVAIGDVNGDGAPDLVVANFTSRNVSILLGHGNGTFGVAVNYDVGGVVSSVAIGDVNGDGKLDLAVANLGSNAVSILLGIGDGTFGAAVDYFTVSPNSVAVGDVNGDGKPDLAVPNTGSNTVSILLGSGNGTFASGVTYGTGGGPSSVAIGDVNGDGTPDLAVANYSQNVSILLGNGNGTFGVMVNYGVATGWGPSSMALGDVNGDGTPDLAVASSYLPNVSILLGNGNGTFAPAVNYSVGTDPSSVAIGDVNGDGKPDLAVANPDFASNTVSILLGNGHGTFATAVHYTVDTGPSSVAIGDVNGDGKPDLALATGANTVSILLQTSCVAVPDLTMTKAHAGNFTQGQTDATYTITVANTGGAPATATVTLTDTLPPGLTATALSGSGWSCSLGTLTCTRNDELAAGASYPALTLTVNVASNAPTSVTNTATVSGGNEINTGNDTASDPTTVTPATNPTAGANHAPIAVAGRDLTVGTIGVQPVAVTLSGATSSDPDGDPLTYSWVDATGHRIGSTAVVSVSLPPGLHDFALTVSDGRGGTGSDGVSVLVVGDTEPPMVIPPDDITVGITTDTGATGSDDDDLAHFLTSSHAGDWIDPTPAFLDARVNGATVGNSYEFPIGVTTVTFRWSDHSANIGSATATVTVLDHLKKGDLLVGQSYPVYETFGSPSVGRIERVRNGVASVFCETPWDSGDPMFWDGPSELIVDLKGRVVFLAQRNDGGIRMLRCTRPGDPPELIADFARRAVDAPPTAALPFPRYGFADPSTGYFHYSGLHLATRKIVEANTGTSGSDLKVVDNETYNFQAGFFELFTPGAQVKTFVYHPATGKWETNGPAGVTYPNSPETSHMFYNGGTTYAVNSNIIRGVVDPFHIKAGLKIGSEFSGSLDYMLGGGAKEYASLMMNDANIPDVTLPPTLCGGALVPLVGGGFSSVGYMNGVIVDTWGSLGLIVTAQPPFLTNINEDMFKANGAAPTFPQPFNECLPTPEILFSAPLAYYSPSTGHVNVVDRVASTSLGIVGSRFWGNDIVKLPAFGRDEVETVINNIWHPMGIAGFPAKISPGYGVTLGISIQSPVNILMTDAQGRRIGMDLLTGQPVNDFGADGVDSGADTEPRYFFVRDPAPGPYTVQTVGTGDGPYTVDVYSADTATGLSSRLTHTGTAAPGSIAVHDFALGADVRLAFTSPSTNRAPMAVAGVDQTVEATSPAGATVHLDGSASSDPDGDALDYIWTGPFGVLNGAVVNPVLPVGTHALTLTVDDGHGGNAKTILVVTVNASPNGAPTANAGPDQIVEATSPAGATVVLDGSASTDPDLDALTFTWSGAFGIASGLTPSVVLPLGTQEVTLAVDDGHGHTATATSHVTVHDTMPPIVTCGIADGLWHAADVGIACAASDSGLGLATATDASFSLVTSVAVGTETTSAETTTRTVCDAVGNCATAGPIGGNQVDRQAPAIHVILPAGGTYLVGESVSAAISCDDGGSGVATCATVGGDIDTSVPGTRNLTVTAADRVGNTSSANASYTVAAPPPPPPNAPDGRMVGMGHLDNGGVHHHFAFRVSQLANADAGRFEYWVNDPKRSSHQDDDRYGSDDDGNHDGAYGRDRRRAMRVFQATAIESVTFLDDPAFQPGTKTGKRQPTVDTVTIVGAGKWNGKDGYRFEARATDQGEPGRHRDVFSIVVKDSRGTIVASVAGSLDGGNIQSMRLMSR